ncbi:MAG TPA: DUF2721 domain-containing protein [Chitinispirillaceae bacterium]|jgi:hypothetical protein|nr:DUF2721 domain-containing protein [Chitinispirillaceae bacterium]
MNLASRLTHTTPTLLFSAISLLLLAYTNRFHALAALIRDLHHQYTLKQEPLILAQIKSLQKRIAIIRNMQFIAVIAFFFCTACIFLLFFGYLTAAEITFIISITALMISLFLSALEINRSSDDINMQLHNLEEHK